MLRVEKIYHFMLDRQSRTKQQVAVGIGLSVATCNTLLNVMVVQGIISGGTKVSGEAGRSAILNQVNDDHECYLAIQFYIVQKTKWIESIVFSTTGNIFSKVTQKYDVVDYKQVETIIADFITRNPNMKYVDRQLLYIFGIIRQFILIMIK